MPDGGLESTFPEGVSRYPVGRGGLGIKKGCSGIKKGRPGIRFPLLIAESKKVED